jgi:hypothetical protein
VLERLNGEEFKAWSDFGFIFNENDLFLSGGAITSWILGEKVYDYDLYFKSPDVAKRFRNSVVVWLNEMPSAADRIFASTTAAEYLHLVSKEVETKATNEETWCVTENAISFRNGLQIMTEMHSGDPQHVTKRFDFKHATAYYDFKTDKLHISKAALDAILQKKLVYNSHNTKPYPALMDSITSKRIAKFRKRGWSIENQYEMFVKGALMKSLFSDKVSDIV